MSTFAGFDVSQAKPYVSVVDDQGRELWRFLQCCPRYAKAKPDRLLVSRSLKKAGNPRTSLQTPATAQFPLGLKEETRRATSQRAAFGLTGLTARLRAPRAPDFSDFKPNRRVFVRLTSCSRGSRIPAYLTPCFLSPG